MSKHYFEHKMKLFVTSKTIFYNYYLIFAHRCKYSKVWEQLINRHNLYTKKNLKKPERKTFMTISGENKLSFKSSILQEK